MTDTVDDQSGLTRSDPAVRDGVKPLEWRKTDKVLWTAETFYGTYGIERQSDKLGHTFWCWFKQGFSTETVSGYNPDLAAAKSSAQSEHARNILSALEPRTSPREPASGLFQQIAARAEQARPAHFHQTLEWIAKAARAASSPPAK